MKWHGHVYVITDNAVVLQVPCGQHPYGGLYHVGRCRNACYL